MKVINFTDLSGKFIGVLPLATSQSPSSGDAYLAQRFIQLMDETELENYFRRIIRGNSRFFVILITDSGFVILARNRPREIANAETVASVCIQEHCVLLHPSDKYDPYHLIRNDNDKIIKVDRADNKPTADENAIKFTRLFRMTQEMVHGSLKQAFQMLDSRHLPTSYLQPFSEAFLAKHGLDPAFKVVPKLTYYVIDCLSLMNASHPGYYPHFRNDHEQKIAARQILKRMFLENPLQHAIWPITFDKLKNSPHCKGNWIERSFGENGKYRLFYDLMTVQIV